MSFTKYPKNYHANGYVWHNLAAMGYAKPPSPVKSPQQSIYPTSFNIPQPQQNTNYSYGGGGMGMPPLPGSRTAAPTGAQLSYGFSANVVPAQVPNVPRADSIDGGPGIGWNIGGSNDSGSRSSAGTPKTPDGIHDVIEAQQEKPCQAIFVPDEDMPIYSFGFPSVS